MRRAVVGILTVVIFVTVAAPQASAGLRVHLVQPGETLYGIALHYSVSVDALTRANGLADPTRIRAGQTLTIPSQGIPGQGGSGTPPAAVRKSLPAVRAYPVQRGDTLSSIARRHRTTVATLMRVNGLRSDRLQVGQVLRLPAAGAPPPSSLPLTTPIVTTGRVVLETDTEVLAPRPLRARRGPKTYHTTLAIIAQGTPLRLLAAEPRWVQIQLPDGEIGWVPAEELRVVERLEGRVEPEAAHGVDIVREAMRYLGTPYVWGGESPRGVDCSGFVYVVFSVRLPQLARLRSFDYFQMGVPVDRTNLRPGDLVFFTTYAPGPSHVGIYAGDGRFIQASSGARRVVVTPLDDSYYAARYRGARRLVAP